MSLLKAYRKNVEYLTGKNVLDTDFHNPVIDEETRNLTKADINHYGGSWRINQGIFYTDEELEKIMDELFKVKLP